LIKLIGIFFHHENILKILSSEVKYLVYQDQGKFEFKEGFWIEGGV
jgi:hypothetical protein